MNQNRQTLGPDMYLLANTAHALEKIQLPIQSIGHLQLPPYEATFLLMEEILFIFIIINFYITVLS